MAELTGTEEVVCSFLQTILFSCIRGVCHRHARSILELYGFFVSHLGVLSQVDHCIGCELVQLDLFAGYELNDVDEFGLTLRQAEKFVEGE